MVAADIVKQFCGVSTCDMCTGLQPPEFNRVRSDFTLLVVLGFRDRYEHLIEQPVTCFIELASAII